MWNCGLNWPSLMQKYHILEALPQAHTRVLPLNSVRASPQISIIPFTDNFWIRLSLYPSFVRPGDLDLWPLDLKMTRSYRHRADSVTHFNCGVAFQMNHGPANRSMHCCVVLDGVSYERLHDHSLVLCVKCVCNFNLLCSM